MSMQFPIIIENKPELCRLIRDIDREVRKEEVSTIKPFMSKQDVYKIVGRDLADRAIKNGNLRIRMKEGRIVIFRKDFETWLEKTR